MANEIRLFHHELESMPMYMSSIPTGTTLWKMWLRPVGVDQWVVGQYVPARHHFNANTVGIRWFQVVLRQGPAPMDYKAPDWSNYQRFEKFGFGR